MIDQLSKYFSWDEAVHSQTAARMGLDNNPSEDVRATIMRTAEHMDEVRQYLEHPVLVSSWYRSSDVNVAVGGSPESQHILGEAVDFTCPGYGSVKQVFDAVRHRPMLAFDQVILEFEAWVHISFSLAPRGRALIIDRSGTRLA